MIIIIILINIIVYFFLLQNHLIGLIGVLLSFKFGPNSGRFSFTLSNFLAFLNVSKTKKIIIFLYFFLLF